MRIFLFPILALVLVLGLFVPMAVPAGADDPVAPVIIYGTEQGGGTNNASPVSGDIYEIDVANGVVNKLFSTGLGVANQPYYPNGNAFDAANNRLYPGFPISTRSDLILVHL